MSTSTRDVVLLSSALVGLASAAGVAWIHSHLLTEIAYATAFDINHVVDCSALLLSPYARVGTLPVAVIGLVWFAVATVLTNGVSVGRPDDPAGRVRWTYLFYVTAAGAGVALYFVVVSARLRTVCLPVDVEIASALTLFVVAVGSAFVVPQGIFRFLFRDLQAARAGDLGVAPLLVVVTAGTCLMMFPRDVMGPSGSADGVFDSGARPADEGGRQNAEEMVAALRQGKRFDTEGLTEGQVMVVEFTDYQCPACRKAEELYQTLFSDYSSRKPTRVTVSRRDFPLDSRCNSLVPRVVHPAACDAAVAVRLAERVGRADEMRTWLFENQQALTETSVAMEADRLVGRGEFASRYDGVVTDIRKETSELGKLSIIGTPTFFVNGIKLPGAVTVDVMKDLIDAELNSVEVGTSRAIGRRKSPE